jgi:hypothetical protein
VLLGVLVAVAGGAVIAFGDLLGAAPAARRRRRCSATPSP